MEWYIFRTKNPTKLIRDIFKNELIATGINLRNKIKNRKKEEKERKVKEEEEEKEKKRREEKERRKEVVTDHHSTESCVYFSIRIIRIRYDSAS
ncbi:hypothetical protein V1478_009182, partial [Vespula squamosa]